MLYGFENKKFYVDLLSCSRPFLNLREEYRIRAREIALLGEKIILSFSGGMDSQAVLQSFIDQHIYIETAFLHLPGYNDVEYDQVKKIDKKYNINTCIIDIDPMVFKEEINDLSLSLDIPGKNHLLQRKFLSYLPEDYNFVQAMPEPFIYINPTSKNKYYYQGYYTAEISRQRSLESLNRSGKIILFGDTPEIQASIMNDEIFESAMASSDYFDGNNLSSPGKNLLTLDRYDYYIKPLIYAKYWKDELEYFPKFLGFENIDYLNEKTKKIKKHAVVIPYENAKTFISRIDGSKRRYFENVPYDEENKLLEQIIDSQGNTINIKYVENLFEGDTYNFFLSQIEELKSSGYRIEKSLPLSGSAIIAELNQTIIGIVAYNTNLRKSENLVWLILGSVDKEYRKKGIYKLMRKHFEFLSKNQGFVGVASHIHQNNQIALEASQNLGAEKIYHYMIKWLT